MGGIGGNDSLLKSSIGFKQFKVAKEVEDIEKWLDLQEMKYEQTVHIAVGMHEPLSESAD